ncbi:glycosyltransferase family 9 protein [Engelhardtia mirabilis]|uniref:ADP-heptose--LPS heptosyltransferase 2 n=1 Tax=Engelhardtia mirabilis TaxID=2528011 RepID=A0A518BIV7_9BACT|nr:ADP-heptose--LPS heptosyltransferase 2 [Planctomycetes bacterium Pla133]QDV01229.1 ADP-heptose--LPS heptosyltransferase 2 [Planctomycetes bacterium Pla86]
MPASEPHPLADCGPPRRILIVRLSALGDVVCALPLYHGLRARWPEAELAWAVQTEHAPLVAGLAGIARVCSFERRGGIGAWRRLARQLRDFAPDLTVDVQGNLKSAATTLSSRAPLRVGLHPDDWRESMGSRSLTHHAPRAAGPHVVDRGLALSRWLTGREAPPRFDPELSAPERHAGRERLRGLLGDEPAPVAIQLGAPGDPRSWTLRGYAECAGLLSAAGRAVLVLAGPVEGEALAVLSAALSGTGETRAGRFATVLERGGGRETAALLAAVAERGGDFVGTDSGPSHLAAAVGLPVTLIAGPQDPARTGPYPPSGGHHRVVLSHPAPPCRPCIKRRCEHEEGPVCTAGIRAEQVIEALSRRRG